MQHLGNRRSVQICAQKAGSYAHVQKWLPFGKMHERLVIDVFKTGALIRTFTNLKVIYDV